MGILLRRRTPTPEAARRPLHWLATVFRPVDLAGLGQKVLARQAAEILVWCGATALLASGLRTVLPILSVTSLFLVPVIAISLRLGFRPAVAATGLGFVAGALFYEPHFSLQVWTPSDVVDLAVFASIGVAISVVGDGLRRSTLALRRQREDLAGLYAMSHDMARAADRHALLSAITAHLERTLGHAVTVHIVDPDARSTADTSVPAVVRAAVPGTLPATELQTVVVPAEGDLWVIAAAGQSLGPVLAIAARLQEKTARDPDAVERVTSMLADAALSLDRLGVAYALEQQRFREQREAVRNSLLDAASHELRTPLATILGTLTALTHSPGLQHDAPLRDLTTLAADECRRLNRVIQNLLDAGRVRSGEIVPRRTVVEAADLVDVALRNSGLRLKEHTVVRTIPPDPVLLAVDPMLAEQALINILENAAKFSAAGTTIAVTVESRGSAAAIVVKDEGIGLAADELNGVFDRYYRAKNERQVAGSGLGLSIARAFVEANGGSIVATSDGHGYGTAFTLTFPSSTAQDDKADDF